MSGPMIEMDWGSESSLNNVMRDWKRVTKEEIKIEYIKGAYYAYGSEFAMLRLFFHYNKHFPNPKTRAAYSENTKSWYFSLEVGQ